MDYEELSYRRMLQVIESGRICRVAVMRGGAPYVVPMCFVCRMDGCIPTFELQARHDGALLEALSGCSHVTLQFERSARGGATETVLVYGRAAVEQMLPADVPRRPQREADIWAQTGAVRFDERRTPAADGGCRDRWEASAMPQREGCRCTEGCPCSCGAASGDACPLYPCGQETDGRCGRTAENADRYDRYDPLHESACGSGCGWTNGCTDRYEHTPRTTDCADRYDRCRPAPQPHCPARITVTAVEMTGRCYPACAARCRSGAEWTE